MGTTAGYTTQHVAELEVMRTGTGSHWGFARNAHEQNKKKQVWQHVDKCNSEDDI